MIKTIAIDDEPLAIRVLKRYVEASTNIELLATSTNALEAYELIENLQPELLLLDINMPKLSGISILKTLPNPPLVIFTTAYSDYALEGFDLNAVDYLLKPFSFDRFQKAIEKTQKLLGTSPIKTRLSFKQDKKLYQIPWEEVLYFNAYGDYVKIISKKKSYLTKARLAEFEAKMPPIFMKIHRSYIIQLDKVEYMEGNQIKIGEELLPISQHYREAVLNYLKQ